MAGAYITNKLAETVVAYVLCYDCYTLCWSEVRPLTWSVQALQGNYVVSVTSIITIRKTRLMAKLSAVDIITFLSFFKL